nr:hypothetical protein CFP56_07476 [Quercus suber]
MASAICGHRWHKRKVSNESTAVSGASRGCRSRRWTQHGAGTCSLSLTPVPTSSISLAIDRDGCLHYLQLLGAADRFGTLCVIRTVRPDCSGGGTPVSAFTTVSSDRSVSQSSFSRIWVQSIGQEPIIWLHSVANPACMDCSAIRVNRPERSSEKAEAAMSTRCPL